MKKALRLLALLAVSVFSRAQSVGDTIRVQAFNYDSTTRDTLLQFPDNPLLTFEKIILKYNMRCKNATVLNGADDGVTGCGEWDYSCNTFIADSSKVENVLTPWPDYAISNFSGPSFPYTTQQTYDHYDFTQQQVNLNGITSETAYQLNSFSESMSHVLQTSKRSGRTQMLFTAAELQAAGATAGPLNSIGFNVSNAGGAVRFLKILIKPTALTSLAASTISFDGFTEVYFRDFTFANGPNKLYFHTPYNWDGMSNLIVELSFSNDETMPDIEFQSTSGGATRLVTATNIGSIDTSAGAVDINTEHFDSISNELTVAFWAFGDAAQMPTDNSIVYGYSTDVNQRELNLHLPWAGQIYFDCGYDGGGFDRIEKPFGDEANIEGRWNHWAFTKNVATGDMKIYLNGALWHSGTGKTRAIELMKFYLGKMIDNGTDRHFKGRIRELSVWNKELSAANISSWKNKMIDATHPNYNSLVAYYKLDEMEGQTVTDSKYGLTSAATNISWDFERGDQLTTTFAEFNRLPVVIFYRGDYDLTVSPVVTRFSHPRAPHTVQHYSVTSNEGVVPMADDELNLLSTQNLFEATPENVYNGETGMLVETLPVAAEGTIAVTPLPYFKRYPFYNELVSFVTPYGIGLDLGPNGKSWYFDMSDYVTLLKGPKRLVMSGGVWQEELDLEFLFIVGTPPRNIVQYEQLWQGQYRLGSPNIAEINNGSKLPTNDFTFSPEASAFKLKSSITGHGAEGEFSQNGGTIQHRIFADNVQRFSWAITQDCSENPIFPQGGTWVYNRQGWCPGQRTLLKEQDMAAFATPGATMALDYRTSAPSVSGGDYRYIIAHQVVGYGAPNFSTDAAIENVKSPNDFNAEFLRINPMCDQPKITLRNTGANVITSVEIAYWLNDADTHQNYTWTGNLPSMAATDIALPTAALWENGLMASGNKFHAEVASVNGGADGYSHNNPYTTSLTLPDVLPTTFKIRLRTNSAPTQNNYTLYDDAGNVVDTKTFTSPNTVHTYTYAAPQVSPGCYHIRVNDTGKNGLSWWATPGQGSGYIRILDENDAVIKNFNPDFGGGFDYHLSVDALLANEVFAPDSQVKVYPNPARGQFIVESDNLIGAQITVMDMLGKMVAKALSDDIAYTFDASRMNAGLYIVKVEKNGKAETKKLVIY
jgi:hypothetical protein